MGRTRGVVPQVLVAAGLALGLAAGVLPGLSGCKARTLVSQSMRLGEMRASGNNAMELGDWNRAVDAYGAYIAERPHEPEVRYLMGTALLNLSRPVEAKEHMRIAYDLMPFEQKYAEGAARALAESGRPDQLYAFLLDLADNTRSDAGLIVFGRYARQAGLVDEAERALKRAALRTGRTSPVPHKALAEFYKSVGDQKLEVERLRAAMFLDPNDVEVAARVRELGLIPGPTFALDPVSLDG
jgi:Flp pilus assembly protein TadD